ncbi:MAG: ATP-binding cassette domain-containing protein [Pseudomonadota bacterium]
MSPGKARLETSGLTVRASDGDREFRLDIGQLEITSGEVIGLSGPSGTGKTMLLEVLGLLRRPEPGATFRLRTESVDVDLSNLWSSGAAHFEAPFLRGKYFGFVPQSGGLLPYLSVSENIAISQRIAKRLAPDWQADLEGLLGLSKLGRLKPAALSIGQRQRVAIARALAHRPAFLIADEPTAALDPENAMAALSLLIDAARTGQAAVILSSHDLALLERFPLRRLYVELDPTSRANSVRSQVRDGTRSAAPSP